MDASCLVRLAAKRDLPEIDAIERLTFTDPWPRSSFVELLGGTSWVAESRGRVVGYLLGRVAADEAEILNLAVHPDSRRNGFARTLLDTALSKFGSEGVKNVYLEVRVSNQEAQAFYQRFGFTQQGLRRRYYDSPPEDALIMALEIGDPKQPEKKR